MLIEQNVFLSRFGFHPVDHTTFLKLKRLKKIYWEAVKTWAACRRWDRKQPENRFFWEPRKDRTEKRKRSDVPIPEPKVCLVWWGYSWANLLPDGGLLAAFEAARMPKQKPDDVQPIRLSIEQIDKLLDAAERWYADQ